MLKANGKYIDTLPLTTLFSQEEAKADTVLIEVDRHYGSHDLAEFDFIMRGVTASGGETEVRLEKEILEDVLHLSWVVGADFTAEAGQLALDLLAFRYPEGADPASEGAEPEVLLRYQLPAVTVRPLPDAEHTLDTQSYTVFLLQVRETAEAGITLVNQTIADFRAEVIPSYDLRFTQDEARITALETRAATDETELSRVASEADYHDRVLMDTLIPKITADEAQLTANTTRLSGIPDFSFLTLEAYKTMETHNANTLYLIVN